jgi:List-Bact-rpt repeat protein
MRHRSKPSSLWPAAALAAAALVIGASQAEPAGASHVAPFVGTWHNVDQATREQTRAVIGVDGADFQVWGYGSCSPTECDWSIRAGGPRTTPQADAADGRLSVVWEFGYARRSETYTLLPDGRLENTSFTQYLDGSGRPDRWSTEYFHRSTPPAVFHTVAVAVGGRGGGAVTSLPAGLDCPSSACSLEFERGSSVVLTATPAEGSKLARWTGSCRRSGATCTLTVQGDTTAVAVFVPIPPCVVPALLRKTLARARRALAVAHCRLHGVRHAYSRSIRRARIARQWPPAGTRLRNGGRVSVVVSRGPRR